MMKPVAVGQEDDSVCKVLAEQARTPKFRIPAPTKSQEQLHVYNSIGEGQRQEYPERFAGEQV